jgi:hypothetical protein
MREGHILEMFTQAPNWGVLGVPGGVVRDTTGTEIDPQTFAVRGGTLVDTGIGHYALLLNGGRLLDGRSKTAVITPAPFLANIGGAAALDQIQTRRSIEAAYDAFGGSAQ